MQSVPITTKVVSSITRSWKGVLNTTLCDQVCQWLSEGQGFSPDTPFSTTNKTIILLKVTLNKAKTCLTEMHIPVNNGLEKPLSTDVQTSTVIWLHDTKLLPNNLLIFAFAPLSKNKPGKVLLVLCWASYIKEKEEWKSSLGIRMC
jgi:hypothetical protein